MSKMRAAMFAMVVMSLAMPLMGYKTSIAQTGPYNTLLSMGRGTAFTAVWRPDGGQLAVVGSQGIWIYDETLKDNAFFRDDPIIALSWNPIGTQIASIDANGNVRIRDAITGTVNYTLDNGTANAYSIAWSPDGTRLAAGNSDNMIQIWSATNGQTTTQYQGHQKSVLGLAWSPDGSRLASASADSTVRIWDAITGQVLYVINGDQPLAISMVAWSPDGSYLAFPIGNHVSLWNNTSQQIVAQLANSAIQKIFSVSWSPDSTHLAVAGQATSVQIWDVATRQVQQSLVGHSRLATPVRWSSKNSLVSIDGDNTIRLWNPTTGQLVRTLQEHDEAIKAVAWSPDGRFLAGSEDLSYYANLRIWNVTTGQLLAIGEKTTYGMNWEGTSVISWSPDGSRIAGAARGGEVVLWDTATYQIANRFQGSPSEIISIAWSPDSSLLLGGLLGQIRIWDSRNGQLRRILDITSLNDNSQVGVTGVAWSPDGSRFAIACEDGTVRMFNSAGQSIFVQKVHSSESGTGNYSVSWFPDGSRLATKGDILDANTGQTIRQIGGVGEVAALQANGTFLASTDEDSELSILIMNVDTGATVTRLEDNTAKVNSLAWSPDGHKLASGNAIGMVHIIADTSIPTLTPSRTAALTAIPSNTATYAPTLIPTDTPTLTPTNTATPTPTQTFTPTFTATATQANTTTPTPQPVTLSPAQLWIGLKNSDDVGIKFDLMAEVYEGSNVIGSGQLNSVSGGSSGFNNAHVYSVPLTLTSSFSVQLGDQLSIKVYVRNACSGSGKNSGFARLWYNDSQADSRFGVTLDGNTTTYYLLDNFLLGSNIGAGPKKTIDVAAGAKCSPFKLFGTWSRTM
jgi:WD40 repeat protein